MVRHISGSFTITIKKSGKDYTLEADGPKKIQVTPQPSPKLKTLLSDEQIRAARDDLANENGTATSVQIQKLGQALYSVLFIQPILEAFHKAQDSIGKDNGLRLRLQIESSELAALPWETLHDGKDWLSTQSSNPVVRKLILNSDIKTLQRLQVRGALRILFVGASPKSQKGEKLANLESEIKKTAEELKKLLNEYIKKKQIVFDLLLNASLKEVQQTLTKDYHILYFAGHGSPEGIILDDGQGEIKQGERGRGEKPKEPVSAETLAQALEGKPTRLVFLAACETSKPSDKSPFAGFAQELAQRSKLPAIVAMQYYISNRQAIHLTAQFFVGLAAGCPVDVALAEARKVLIRNGQVGRDVFAPVLYLQAENGALFQKAKNWPAISLSVALVIAIIAGGYQWQRVQREQIEQNALAAKSLSSTSPLTSLITAISLVGKSRSPLISFPNQLLPLSVKDSLFSAVQSSWETNVFKVDGSVLSIKNSIDGFVILNQDTDDTLHLWNSKGKRIATLEGKQPYLTAVAISTDISTIVSGGGDGTVRLWNRNGKSLATLKAHQDQVSSIAISTDGSTIVTGGRDGIVRLWDNKGKPVATLKAHQDDVESVAISTDRYTIVSGGRDGTVRLWNRNGKSLATLKAHQRFLSQRNFVSDVAISEDNSTIVTGSTHGELRLWDNRGKPVATLEGYQSFLRKVAISTDGSIIVSGGSNGEVNFWNRKGERVATLKGHQDEVSSIAISEDNSTIVTGGNDGTLRLWNSKGKPVATLSGHQGHIGNVAISADGSTIVSDGNDGVRVWDRKVNLVATLLDEQTYVGKVAISADGSTIVSDGNDGVHLWDRNGKLLANLSGLEEDISISGNGSTIVSGRADGVRVWDRNGKLLTTLSGHQYGVKRVEISADGSTIASGDNDATVRLWDRNGKPLATLRDHQISNQENFIFAIAISTDGSTIASGGTDGFVRLWDNKGNPVATSSESKGIVRYVAINSDGSRIVSAGSADGTVQLWDRQGKLVATLSGHQGEVNSVAISTDGSTIVSGGNDGTVRLWDSKGKLVATLLGHQNKVNSVAISTDGSMVVSGGEDGTVRLWNRQGNPVATLSGLSGINSVAISTDGSMVVSGGNDDVRLWDIKFESWLKVACERLRYHPVFKNPQTQVENEAKATCMQ